MAAEKSHWFADVTLNVARGQAPPTISGLEVSLWHTVPNKDGTGGTEVSTGGYARQAVTLGVPGAGSVGRKSVNTAQVLFPQATADYADLVRGWCIHRSNATQEALWIHWFDPADYRTVLEGDVPFFGAGEMEVEEA